MYKSLLCVFSLGLAASGAIAEEVAKPVELTEAQLDQVTAGLVTVVAVDVVDINQNDVDVAIPVNAAAAVAVLGESTAVAIQPGRIRQ